MHPTHIHRKCQPRWVCTRTSQLTTANHNSQLAIAHGKSCFVDFPSNFPYNIFTYSCIWWYFQQLLPTDKIRSVWLMRENEKGTWKLKKPGRRLKRENASATKMVVFIKHLSLKALVLLAVSTKVTNKNAKKYNFKICFPDLLTFREVHIIGIKFASKNWS